MERSVLKLGLKPVQKSSELLITTVTEHPINIHTRTRVIGKLAGGSINSPVPKKLKGHTLEMYLIVKASQILMFPTRRRINKIIRLITYYKEVCIIDQDKDWLCFWQMPKNLRRNNLLDSRCFCGDWLIRYINQALLFLLAMNMIVLDRSTI